MFMMVVVVVVIGFRICSLVESCKVVLNLKIFILIAYKSLNEIGNLKKHINLFQLVNINFFIPSFVPFFFLLYLYLFSMTLDVIHSQMHFIGIFLGPISVTI